MDRARNKLPNELTDKDMAEDEFVEWSKHIPKPEQVSRMAKLPTRNLYERFGEIKNKKCVLNFDMRY